LLMSACRFIRVTPSVISGIVRVHSKLIFLHVASLQLSTDHFPDGGKNWKKAVNTSPCTQLSER